MKTKPRWVHPFGGWQRVDAVTFEHWLSVPTPAKIAASLVGILIIC